MLPILLFLGFIAIIALAYAGDYWLDCREEAETIHPEPME